MFKFETAQAPSTHPTQPREDLESTHRLIVLVPANINFSAAAQRIWGLAQTTDMEIQLIGLPNDSTEESRLRRELITLASLLQGGKRCATMQIKMGTNWAEALTTTSQAGDMIVCFAEPQTGIFRKPLSQILKLNQKATVYVLADLTPEKSAANRSLQISTWLGIIAVIAGFGLLQAKIVQLPAGWFQNILLILSLIPEFWLIWVWDSRFR